MKCGVFIRKIIEKYPEFGTKPGEWRIRREIVDELIRWAEDKDTISVCMVGEGILFAIGCKKLQKEL